MQSRQERYKLFCGKQNARRSISGLIWTYFPPEILEVAFERTECALEPLTNVFAVAVIDEARTSTSMNEETDEHSMS